MEALFHTLQDFFHSVGLPLQQDMDITVHALDGLHGDKPLASPLFRTNYYSFLLISEGKGKYSIDDREYELGPGSFYFTNPGHLKSFGIEELLQGYMLTFTENFVKQHYSGDFYTLFPFLLHESAPVMQVGEPIMGDLSQLFEQMLREYEGASLYKSAILTKQLAILLYKTKELLLSHRVALHPRNRASEIARDFKKLLNDNFRDLATGRTEKVHSIKTFAGHLHVHPNYLSNVLKEETGKPASEWVQERTLSEASSLLRNTSMTVSQIASRLGFADAAHFGKFFKKRARVSPGEFRRSQHL